MASEQFSLCWDNFLKNMSAGMSTLLENEDLVDVTLAVEGKYLKAHKMVLSVCSPYFKELFKINPCKHPIVFMKDVTYSAMSDLLQFMYQGEVQVSQESLTTFIKTAEALQIKGLTGDGNGATDNDIEEIEDDEPTKIVEIEKSPAQRLKKTQATTLVQPAPKRQRLSNSTSTDPKSVTSSSKTDLTLTETTTTNKDSLMHLKIEPNETVHTESIKVIDEINDIVDDPLDDAAIDDNEDYTIMEGADEEPQAGTSTEGVTSEGQGESEIKLRKKLPKTAIVVDGFTYHQNTVKKNTNICYLICSEYKRLVCKARAHIPLDGDIEKFVLSKPHNHPPKFEGFIKSDFISDIKKLINYNPNTRLKEIYENVAVSYPEAAKQYPFSKLSNSMRRWRNNSNKNFYLGCAEHKNLLCRGRATIPVGGTLDMLVMTQPHNHPPDLNAEEKDAFMKELKKGVRAIKNTTLKKVYEILSEAYPKAADEISFKSVSSSMHRWRKNPLM